MDGFAIHAPCTKTAYSPKRWRIGLPKAVFHVAVCRLLTCKRPCFAKPLFLRWFPRGVARVVLRPCVAACGAALVPGDAFCVMSDAGMPGVQACPCVGRCSFRFVAGFAVRYALRPWVAQAWFISRRIVRVFVNRFLPHRMSLPRVFQRRFCIKIGISCMIKS